MLEDQLRRRLEALNRGALPESAVAAKPPTIEAARPRAEARSPAKGSVVKPLPGLMRGGEVVVTEAGEHLRIRLPIEPMWPGGAQLATRRIEHLHQLAAEAREAIEPTVVMRPELAAVVAALPDRVLLLDLETCGFAGSALFLVGLLRQIEGAPTVELLLVQMGE